MIQLKKDRLVQQRTHKHRPEPEKQFEAKTSSEKAANLSYRSKKLARLVLVCG